MKRLLVLCTFPFLFACGSDEGTAADVTEVTGQEVAQDIVTSDTLPEPEIVAETIQEVAVDKPVTKVTFKGTVIEFGSKPPKPIEGADIAVLSMTDGKPTGLTLKSGPGGKVEIPDLDSDKPIGLKMSKDGYKDTYQFGFDPASQDETIWIVTTTLYNLAPALAGLVVDTTKGIVAGGIYFLKNGEEIMVGCATIKTDPEGEYRYFDPASGLPTTPDKADQTSTKLSYFLAGNVPAGTEDAPALTKVQAYLGDEKIGEETIFTVKDSICIKNIYTTKETPAGCTK